MWWLWVACADVGTVGGIPLDDLEGWLEDGEYLAWPSEPAVHRSAGPHFGDVLTYLSPDLAASLESGQERHAEGAAAVKELYGDSDDVLGHTVMVRAGTGGGGNAWYWYEVFEGRTFADGRGESVCTGCHEPGQDFILTEWPQ